MLDDGTDARIASAFAAISASAAKNRLYAALARKQGRTERARLLEAISRAESVQARRLLMTLRGRVADLVPYCEELAERKAETSNVVAPRLEKAFSAEGKRYEAEFFERLSRTSRIHHHLLKSAEAHGEGEPPVYYVCQVCGFIATDHVPDQCPVCNAVPGRFVSDSS